MDERKDFGNCTKQSQYCDDITDENPDKCTFYILIFIKMKHKKLSFELGGLK